MPSKEDKTFFLYSIGRALDDLTIGSLVLEDYTNPTHARHYTHPPLEDGELSRIATIDPLSNCIVNAHDSARFGIKVEAGDLVNVDLGWSSTKEKILFAKSAKRIELKMPEKFLSQFVLSESNREARDIVKLWISAATLDYLVKLQFWRKPKIWMVTGLYTFEGAKFLELNSTDPKFNAGISSIATSLLTGLPLGGSADIGKSHSLKVGYEMDKEQVWAAQFRRLDIDYIHVSGDDEASLPTEIPLLNVFNPGTLRAGAEEANGFRVSILEEGITDSQEDKDYRDKLELAIEEVEGAQNTV
ncbi:hypothetical protein IFM5058_10944 [Aspergillus udagawae]|nr:hypothetical protein IFM5058_10944 [Aspergillus udagawae]